MAITNIGNLTYASAEINEIFNNAKSKMEGVIGSSSFSSPEDAFVGMDINNLSTFTNAVTAYRDKVQGIIDGFNEKAKTDAAFKGEVATAVSNFLVGMKELLKSYVSQINSEIAWINEAAENWTTGATTIASQADSDTSTIRSLADGVNLDASGTAGGASTQR